MLLWQAKSTTKQIYTHHGQAANSTAATLVQCAIPGIVVDAKEVASRLAIKLCILYLAQGMLVSEFTSLEVSHQGFVAPVLVETSSQHPTQQALP